MSKKILFLNKPTLLNKLCFLKKLRFELLHLDKACYIKALCERSLNSKSYFVKIDKFKAQKVLLFVCFDVC
ncbi:hypothetical protein DMC01_03585 [Campylobacter troglodytis]|nr:hypothetical protein DMC01_03585 [Campylobacter troglodytis]